MRNAFILLSAGAALFATCANAETLDCNGISTTDDLSNVSAGVVTAAKVNFLVNQSDKPGCPSAAATCQRHGFLLAGNTVAYDNGATKTGLVCAAFIDTKGRETDGWIPLAALKPLTAPPNWIGKWKRDTSGEIDITKKSATDVAVSGNATWGSGAATHEGDIDADIDPRKAVQSFAISGDKQIAYAKADQYDCAVMLKQVGPYLFVNDNNNCGGANVSFSGLYLRR